MKNARTSLFLVVALGLLALCPVGLADEFADKSVPLFCAVGWLGEFTHIDPSVGEVPPTRNDLPFTLQALAWSPDGILYAGAGNRNGLYKIDPRTGNVEYFLPANVDIAGMAFSPSGELYVTGSSGARYLRTIDLTDGSSTSDRTLWGDRNSAQGLAFSPDGTLYAIKPNVFPGTYELLTIDLDDAQMHLLGSYSSTANVNQSITFTADGRLYAIGADAFAELNPTDGSLIESHFTLSGDYRGLAIVPPMVYYVDADANGASNGSTWADAFNFLQDALTSAWSGDEIHVAEGVYKPDQGVGFAPEDRTATFQLINGVVIKGGYAGAGTPEPNARDIDLYESILSGDLAGNDVDFINPVDLYDHPTWSENSYHVVTGSGTNKSAVLDGFTITAGNANAVYQYDTNAVGGGMYNNQGSATVANCTFIHNLTLWHGGAMYNEGSNLTLANCTFTENSSIGFNGAGMYNYESSPILTNCTFSNNIAYYNHCAGMYNRRHCSPTLTNCTFIGNKGDGMSNYFDSNATLTDCSFSGNTGCGMANWQSSPTLTGCRFDGNGQGGMANRSGSIPILTNCIITRNSSSRGAGMYNNNSSPILTNCIFSGNRAGDWAGGMYNRYLSSPILTNCTFIGNRARRWGGGMYNNGVSGECNPILTNCTFADNLAGSYGGGILNQACRPTVTNCIVWSNLPEQIFDQYTSVSSVTFSDVQDGWAGEGNIDVEPLFVEPGYWDANGVWVEGDYHLLTDSPCINAGDPNYVAEPNETDLDGRPRVISGRIDMGAYELPVPAEVRIVPRTINLASEGKYITCYIRLGEDYNIADIDPNSVFLENAVQAASLKVDEQQQVAVVRFSQSDVQEILNVGEVELTITGRLTDGTVFEGTDVIRVIDKGGKK